MKSPLPVVEGVGASRLWLLPGAWKTALDFLIEKFPNVAAESWLARMENGKVADETGLRLDATSPYRAGACVFYYRELDSETIVPFADSIIYQDEDILAADKPHFLPVTPSGRFLRETLLVRLKKKTKLEHLVPLHRLDRETAGVVLFSCNPETRSRYARLFNDRQVEKIYDALAADNPTLDFPLTRRSRMTAGEPFFRMKETCGESNSETRINLIERLNGVNLYRMRAVTGKKHQIRVHLAALGIPIVNDKFYPEIIDGADDDFSQPLKLLAKSIRFRDPLTKRERRFESRAELFS